MAKHARHAVEIPDQWKLAGAAMAVIASLVWVLYVYTQPTAFDICGPRPLPQVVETTGETTTTTTLTTTTAPPPVDPAYRQQLEAWADCIQEAGGQPVGTTP